MEKIDNQYFTPDIEDIRVGYECETLVYPYPNWVNTKIEQGDDLNYIQDGSWKVRVPYLTKEQIEAEGWIHFQNSTFKGKYEPMYDMEFWMKGVSMYYRWDINRMQITTNAGLRTWFHGECKDINTFRYICKLLNIK